MNFACEAFSDALVDEMRPLWERHFKETSSANYSGINPAIDVYTTLHQADSLRIFTLRNNAALAGYQVFIVHADPHAKHARVASQDILFIDSGYRQGLLGMKFMKWCIGCLRCEGVNVVHQKVSARNNVGKLLERMGFTLEDLSYSMRLKEEC